MGSANCRLSPSKAKRPLSGNDTQVNSSCNSLTKRRRLHRTFSKAKDALQQQQRTSLLSISNLGSGGSILRPQSGASVAGQVASRQIRRHGMEIIEIPDDIDDNEAIRLGNLSDGRESTILSEIEHISNASSRRELEADEDSLSERLSVGPAADDDDLWGYEIPRPRPASGPDLWAQNIIEPDLEIAAALRRFGQREPDWREFLEDDGSNPDYPDTGNAHADSSGQVKLEDLTPFKSPSAINDQKVECVDDVLSVFPDICRDYVSELYDSGAGEIAEQLVAHILDKLDNGSDYPKAKDKLKTLKRKREVDEDEEAANKYGSLDRENGSHDYSTLTFVIFSVTDSFEHY
jgi:hypothetical protein